MILNQAKEGFTKCPNFLLHAEGVTGTHLFIYLYLRDFSHRKSEARPKLSTIAHRIGKSEKTVRQKLSDLAECGLIEIIHRKGKTSIYRVIPYDGISKKP